MSAGERGRTSIFVSYARADLVFAEALAEGLSEPEFTAFLDRTAILPGEDWRDRIKGLILASDVVLFILSPASVESPVCAWEIELARELGKRIIPVVWRAVPDDRVPSALSALNYLFFNGGRGGEISDESLSILVTSLSEVLRVDVPWMREHTVLVSLASRWQEAGRPSGQLLRRGQIEELEQWLARKPSRSRIPAVLTDFHAASVAREDHDQARLEAPFPWLLILAPVGAIGLYSLIPFVALGRVGLFLRFVLAWMVASVVSTAAMAITSYGWIRRRITEVSFGVGPAFLDASLGRSTIYLRLLPLGGSTVFDETEPFESLLDWRRSLIELSGTASLIAVGWLLGLQADQPARFDLYGIWRDIAVGTVYPLGQGQVILEATVRTLGGESGAVVFQRILYALAAVALLPIPFLSGGNAIMWFAVWSTGWPTLGRRLQLMNLGVLLLLLASLSWGVAIFYYVATVLAQAL